MDGGQAHSVLLAAPGPAPGTRLPASVGGPLGAWPRAPWHGRFPPDSPPPVLHPCSNRSSVLSPLRLLGDVHVGRAAVAFPLRPATSRQASPRSPGSRARIFLTCTGSPTAPGSHAACESATVDIAFPFCTQGRHPKLVFRGSIGGPPVPLSTLHPRCHHRRRMTRGQRGSLLLRRRALASPTPRRLIPALSDSPKIWVARPRLNTRYRGLVPRLPVNSTMPFSHCCVRYSFRRPPISPSDLAGPGTGLIPCVRRERPPSRRAGESPRQA